jgi:hypothetical protein
MRGFPSFFCRSQSTSVQVLHFQGPLSQPSAAGLTCGIQDFSSDRCSYLRFRAWASTLRCIHPIMHGPHDACRRDLSRVKGCFVIMVFQKSYDCELETCHSPKPLCCLPKIPCPRTQITMGMEGKRRRKSRRSGRHTVEAKGSLVG